MLDSLIINQKTRQKLDSFNQAPPQGILLTGPVGVGLKTIALALAKNGQLQSFLQPIKKATGEVDETSGTIPIASIRQLYELLRSKQTGRRFVVIDNADRLSIGAQSAFLKLLEEPAPGVHFILTSHYPEQILATVRSRLQSLNISLATPEDMRPLESQLDVDAATLSQLRFIASGRPAIMKRLAFSQHEFSDFKTVIADAQTALTGSSQQRYIIFYKYGASSTKALALIDVLVMLLRASLKNKPTQHHLKWLQALSDAEYHVYRGANPRLQLLGSML